jgi:hypothetical protein
MVVRCRLLVEVFSEYKYKYRYIVRHENQSIVISSFLPYLLLMAVHRSMKIFSVVLPKPAKTLPRH